MTPYQCTRSYAHEGVPWQEQSEATFGRGPTARLRG